MPRKSPREKSVKRVVGDRDRRAVGDQQADAAQRRQRRQRHDERRQAQLDDAEGVEQRRWRGRCSSVSDDREPDRHSPACSSSAIDHAGEADDRADREVDAGGDDDEGLADREDRDHRALAQQVGDVVLGPEGARGEGAGRSTSAASRPSSVRPSRRLTPAPAAFSRSLAVAVIGRSSPIAVSAAASDADRFGRGSSSCEASLKAWLATIGRGGRRAACRRVRRPRADRTRSG